MNYQGEIEKCMEQHAVLSAAWLSNELQISIRAAIDLMQKYRDSVEGVIAMYRLSSKSASGCFRIEIVSEQDLDKRRNESMLHHQLYSIQRTQSEMIKSKLVESSLIQAEELLNNLTATNGSFLDNAFGGVKVHGLDIKAVGDRIFSSQNLAFDAVAAKASASSAAPLQPAMVANKLLPMSKPSLGSSSSQPYKSANASVAIKQNPVSSSLTLKKIGEKNAEIAKRFFAASEAKLKPDEEMDTSGAGAGDNDEEWDDGAPKRVVTKKPKPVVDKDEIHLGALDKLENERAIESTAMDVDEEEVGSSLPDDKEGKSHGKKKPKVDILKRGAMDDYMEDAAIEEHKRKQADHGTEQPKKKKRVLVEKVRLAQLFFSL